MVLWSSSELPREGSQTIKVKVGRYLIPMSLTYHRDRIACGFPYSPALIDEIKCMEGAKWHGFEDPPRKIWTIANSIRNHFQLDYLQGKNPYAWFERDYPLITPTRKLYTHQIEGISFALARHYCILAYEMGTGKSLIAGEIMERSGLFSSEIWYVAPRSGLRAVELEFEKWGIKTRPGYLLTYEKFTKIVKHWDGRPAPVMIIFDECSKLKTPSAQRSQQAAFVANAIRDEYGASGYVILMSGTPAPKSPADWWHQCEVTCPGYLREGNIGAFRKRLTIVEERENLVTGGTYPHLVTWLDNEKKCAKCGQFEEHTNHRPEWETGQPLFHTFTPSKNEVEHLYKRMDGLVTVRFKKDCLDLPEIQYRIIELMPTAETLRAAQLIRKRSTRAITALTLLRELSDGFQYSDEQIGEETCPACKGAGKQQGKILKEEMEHLYECTGVDVDQFLDAEITCPLCSGAGCIPKMQRKVIEAKSPKDGVLVNMLEEHEEVGRFIVWGGFTGTIERIVAICKKQGWNVLRVDGRGFVGMGPMGEPLDDKLLLAAMDRSHPKFSDLMTIYDKLVFVGHPRAGGMGLNLSASPTELFYSNDFSGEARTQAEQRFHRPSMDTNRGATIYDIIHLPSDKIVLDNLKIKRKLELLTMGELEEAFK